MNLKPPYEYNNETFESIAESVADQTGTKVINGAPATDLITRATIEAGQTGFTFLVPLAEERDRVISCNPQGNILIQQADAKSQSVGVIEEGNQADLISQEFQASFDDRKSFRSYKVTSQTPFGVYTANVVDNTVPEPRHKLSTVET